MGQENNASTHNNSRGEKLSEIQTLTERVRELSGIVNLWTSWYVCFVLLAVIIASVVFFTQFMSIKKGKDLAQTQNELIKAKDEHLVIDLKEKDLKISEANERASNADKIAADAKLETEKLRDKNISLEMAVSPRILEQGLTGESLKPFANAEISVISLPDFEPRRTAGQIRFMLRSVAGWKKFSGSLSHPMAFFDGVVIHVGMSEYARTVAEALVSVLNNNGIVARRGYPVLELGDNGVLVVVGPKPLPKELQLKPENVPSDKRGNRVWGNIMEE